MANENEQYMAIPPGAIVPGALPEFRIYILGPHGGYILWALEGKRVSQEQLDRLSESGVREVFILVEEQFKYEQYLETNLKIILGNQSTSDDQKAEIFSRVSTNVMKGAFETSHGLGTMAAATVKRTQQLIENALIFIRELRSLQALAKMIGRDYQTYEHAIKVLWFTVAFLQLNPDVLEQIDPDYRTFDMGKKTEILRQCGFGALLHDIGKAFVAPELLNKSEPLSDIEWEIMKRHPLNGLAMLMDADIPAFVKKAILYHHEDFHGGGYPFGIEGSNITFLARVLRIVDVFDAMTSRRPYKEPLAPMNVAQIMIGAPDERDKAEDPEHDNRDLGMITCFDKELLRKFILFLGNVKLNR
jgi:HD-GYP domain-containing protein (c-di-GMP phosphodiesterase class II)